MSIQESRDTTSGSTDISNLDGHYSWKGVYALLDADPSYGDEQARRPTSRVGTGRRRRTQTPRRRSSKSGKSAETNTSPEITMSSFSTPTTESSGAQTSENTQDDEQYSAEVSQ